MAEVRFSTFVLSCEDRRDVRNATLQSLEASGWGSAPQLVIDDGVGATRIERIHRTWRRVIQSAATAAADFTLLLEDDVVFGTSFAHNLSSWPLLQQLQPGGAFFASLYNPGRPFILRRAEERYVVAHAHEVWGAQALLMTPAMARYIDVNWHEASGNPDQRMPRIAGRVTPIYFHVPSLVNHAPVPTTWGGIEHNALDFDIDWRAGSLETP